MTNLENRLRESLDAHAEAISPTLSGAAIRQSAQPKPFQRHKLYAPLAAVASVLAIAAVPVILLHRHSTPSVPPGRPPGVVTPMPSPSPSNLPSMSSPPAPTSAPSPITTSAHPTPAKDSTMPTGTPPAPPSTVHTPELPPGHPTSQPSGPSASTPPR